MEDASAVDLDWFWRGWFYSIDHVDIELADIKWFKLDTKNPDIEKPYKKDVKDYVDMNGNIKVDGMEIGYSEDDKYMWYFEDGYEFCKKIDMKLDNEKFPSAIINKAKKIIKDKFDGAKLRDEL